MSVCCNHLSDVLPHNNARESEGGSSFLDLASVTANCVVADAGGDDVDEYADAGVKGHDHTQPQEVRHETAGPKQC